MTARVLVAGIGNIFLSDDGFGVEVARRLGQRDLPADVEVVDIGIRGMHLAYQLLDGYEALLLIDAAPRGGQAGDLYLIEPDLAAIPEDDGALLNAHGMEPDAVLSLIKTMARDQSEPLIERVLLIGCEPQTVEEGMGLSPPVAAAVEAALSMVERVLANELSDTRVRGT
ncbi:MAG: hydrogenase maturation protease [Geodermatophilaceae bacterium]|jgi:hydrogenase maturation protease